MRLYTSGRAFVLACVLAAAVCGAAAAEGLRNIACVTGTAYFDGSWRLESSDVFLARLVPALTVEAKLARVDSDGWYQHLFYLGPVVSFTDNLYLEAVYGLGLEGRYGQGLGSVELFTHEFNVNLNYETASSATSLGLRADWFPQSGYYYFLPSVSGKFHPLPALGLFGKFFLSIDSEEALTQSFWGEADWRFSPLLAARAGFTVSRASAFGYSLIAGVDFFFRPAWSLRYTFQYLSDTIEYLTAPQPYSGIANTLVLDVRF
jgi:hypothetical protein